MYKVGKLVGGGGGGSVQENFPILGHNIIPSSNNRLYLVVEKHGYKMTKRGFIRALLLVFPPKFDLLYKYNLCNIFL